MSTGRGPHRDGGHLALVVPGEESVQYVVAGLCGVLGFGSAAGVVAEEVVEAVAAAGVFVE
jgi:hypothetical protein